LTAAGPLPEDLMRFIDSNIESIEQLEILRILGEFPAREWTATELAKEAQISPSVIAGQLSTLERRGLLQTHTVELMLLCKFAPRSPEIEQPLRALLQFYRERPVTLIKIVYDRANERLKAFADSFRLRKES
jgi:hypothetical protein